MDASLACQRCRQPLMRDPTVASLTPSQYALVAGTLPAPPQSSSLPPTAKLAALPPASRPAAEAWASANPIGESYVLLPEVKERALERERERERKTERRNDKAAKKSSAPKAGTKAVGHPDGKEQGKTHGRGQTSTPSQDPTSASAASTGVSSASSSRTNSPAPPASNETPLAARLESLLSSRTEIDHPLCTECTTLFQMELEREIDELKRERDAFIAFEQGLRRRAEHAEVASVESAEGEGGVGSVQEWDALVARKRQLEEEEKALRATLAEREDELKAVKEDEARMLADEAAVEKEEAEFLKSHAALSGQLTHLANTLSSAKTQLLLSTSLLAHLESANVYNDAFQIGHTTLATDGRGLTVGTINGLRLGGRPTVEWDEINAAWGLVALCIDRLAAKVGLTFQTYKIVPLGSFSRIEDLPPGKGVYDLWTTSDIGRMFQTRRFNQGLVALLDCLRQLDEHTDASGRPRSGPNIEITKDKINGHPIRLPGFASNIPALPSMSLMGLGSAPEDEGNADEQWTRACRAVLLVLKRILLAESEAGRTR